MDTYSNSRTGSVAKLFFAWACACASWVVDSADHNVEEIYYYVDIYLFIAMLLSQVARNVLSLFYFENIASKIWYWFCDVTRKIVKLASYFSRSFNEFWSALVYFYTSWVLFNGRKRQWLPYLLHAMPLYFSSAYENTMSLKTNYSFLEVIGRYITNS